MERSNSMECPIYTNLDRKSSTTDGTINGIGIVALYCLGPRGEYTGTSLVESRGLLWFTRSNVVVLVPGFALRGFLALGGRHFGWKLLWID